MSKDKLKSKIKQKKFRDVFIGLLLLFIIILAGTFAWSGVRNMAFNPLYEQNFGGRFHDNFAPQGSAGRGAGTHDQLLFAENFGSEYIFVRARIREFASINGEPMNLNRPEGVTKMDINDPQTWPIFLANNEDVHVRRADSEAHLIAANDRVIWSLGDTRSERHTFMPTFNHADRMATGIAPTFPTSIPTFNLLNAFEMSEATGHAIDAIAGGNAFNDPSINHEDIADVPTFIDIGQQTGPGLLGFSGVPESDTNQGNYRHFAPGATITSPRLIVDGNNQLTLQNNGELFVHTAQETLKPGHGSVMTLYQWRNNARPLPTRNEADVLINNFWVMDSESNDGWFYFAAPLPPGEGTTLLLNQLILNNVDNQNIEYILLVEAEFANREGLDNGAWGELPPEVEDILFGRQRIAISPRESTLYPRETQQFTVNFERIGRMLPEVIWEVSGTTDNQTYIDENGLLTIGLNEQPGELIVRVIDVETEETDQAYVTVLERREIVIDVDEEGNATITAPPGTDYEVGEEDDAIVITFPPGTDEENITVNVPEDWEYDISEDGEGNLIVTITPPDREIIIDVDEEGNTSITAPPRTDYEVDEEDDTIVITFPPGTDEENITVNVPEDWDYDITEDESGNVIVTITPPNTKFPTVVTPEEVGACSSNQNTGINGKNSPAFWQDQETGMHWCVADTDGDYVMLVSRFVLRFNEPGAPEGAGTASEAIPSFGFTHTRNHSDNTFEVWGAPNEESGNPITHATTRNTEYGPEIRRRVNDWFEDDMFVSPALRSRVVHANIPLHSTDFPVFSRDHARFIDTTHVSTPLTDSTPGEGLPFFLGPADLNTRFGSTPEARRAFHPNELSPSAAAAATYWLRSAGFTSPYMSWVHPVATVTNGNQNWGINNAVFITGSGFRPAIWIYTGDLNERRTIPTAQTGCNQIDPAGTGDAMNVFVDTTGTEWCVVETQTHGETRYSMLVTRFVHDVADSNYQRFHHENTFIPWAQNPDAREHVNRWFRDSSNVSPFLTSRIVQPNLPEMDATRTTAAFNARRDNTTVLSTPQIGSTVTPTDNPVFIMNPSDVNVRIGTSTDALARIYRGSELPVGYWLRSAGDQWYSGTHINHGGSIQARMGNEGGWLPWPSQENFGHIPTRFYEISSRFTFGRNVIRNAPQVGLIGYRPTIWIRH